MVAITDSWPEEAPATRKRAPRKARGRALGCSALLLKSQQIQKETGSTSPHTRQESNSRCLPSRRHEEEKVDYAAPHEIKESKGKISPETIVEL